MKLGRQAQQGYILVVVLLMISLCIMLATYVAYNNSVFLPWASTMVAREKAIMLADSGVQIALAQLGVPKKTKQEEEKSPEKKQEEVTSAPDAAKPPQPALASSAETEQAKDFLRGLLPIINRWQEFTFTKKRDGFDGVLRVCIVCENAKINLNVAYDFEKHTFAGNETVKKLNQELMEKVFERIAAITKGPNLFEPFVRFVKERQYPLEDVTELMLKKDLKLTQQVAPPYEQAYPAYRPY